MPQAENMTALFLRYRQECDAFNLNPLRGGEAEHNRVARNTFQKTERLIRRAPIVTKEDAHAALTFIESEIVDGADWDFLKPILKSLRAYIERAS